MGLHAVFKCDLLARAGIQPNPTYLSTLKICRVELCTELFLCYYPYLVSMLFVDLLSPHLITFLMFLILVHVISFSSRCMLELKFAIYYRAAASL